MFQLSRLFRFLGGNGPSRKQRPKPRPKIWTFRPCLEELERRLVPAANTYTVNTLTDDPTGNGGTGLTGDFRYCLNQAMLPGNAGSTIQFQQNLDGVIDITKPLQAISQNVTIVGPTSSMPNVIVMRDPTAAAFQIFTVSGSNVTAAIDNLAIENGIANLQGGGIENVGGNLTLQNDALYSNESSFSGGAIANLGGGTLNLIMCDIASNSAGSLGGGIYNTGTLEDQGSQIYANAAQSGGGYFGDKGSSATLCGTQFYSNDASAAGGGVYLRNNANFTLCGGSIYHNTAATDGGGLLSASSGTVQLQNTAVSGNMATGGSGGGIAVYSGGNFTMDGGGIGMNTAGQNGGGLANLGGTVLLDQSLNVSKNTATTGNGGGLYLNSTSTTTLNTITIQGNTAPKGAGNGGYLQTGGTLTETNVTDNDDPGKNLVQGP
jgi:hypothetical protein